jgi:outer membrane lipoprotein-sorting protein
MTSCSSIQNNLLAYHVGALGPLAKLQVRRHLKTCPTCAARLAAEVALDARLRRADLAPDSLPAAMLRRRPLRYALVLVPALALGGVFFLRPGTPGGPTIAFADVEKALSDTKYITWMQTQNVVATKETMKATVQRYQARPGTIYTHWIDTENLKLSISSPNGTTLLDTTHQEGYTGKSYYIWNKNQDLSEDIVRTIKELALGPLGPETSEPKLKYLIVKTSPWISKNIIFQEKPVVFFTRTVTTSWDKAEKGRVQIEKAWIEPKTRHLLRRESETVFTEGIRLITINENYRYLNEAPAGTFTPTRPTPGEIYEFDNISGPPRKLLVEDTGVDKSLRRQIGQIVEAMNAGDSTTLVNLGDAKLNASDGPEVLNGKTRAQREQFFRWYLGDIARRRVLRSWKLDPLPGSFTSVMARWHRHTAGASYPPTGPMEVSLGLTGTATLKDGSRQKIRSHVTFRLTPSGPKLIWFDPNNHR